jgi:hypothetical protein
MKNAVIVERKVAGRIDHTLLKAEVTQESWRAHKAAAFLRDRYAI